MMALVGMGVIGLAVAGTRSGSPSKRDLKRQVEALVHWSLDRGMPATTTRGGHWRIETPTGPVFLPSTPSDWRGVKNARALLRRKLREAGWPDEDLP